MVSELFTNYLNGISSPVIATGKSTLQTDGSTISWLSAGLQALSLNVPFKAEEAINPIRTITIGDLGLGFNDQSPWTPSAESNTVQASLRTSSSMHVGRPVTLTGSLKSYHSDSVFPLARLRTTLISPRTETL